MSDVQIMDEPVTEEVTKQPMAVVGLVTIIIPIPGANLIVQAQLYCGVSGFWSGVVGKDVKQGDKLIVFLQDAILPPDPRWAFMERHKWRVRMARFKGVPSECVAILGAPDLHPGTDLTAELGVTKYSKPLPKELAGVAKGNFPSHIPKTDEPNFQRFSDLEYYMTCVWYATVKADGTSCTAYVEDGVLHVCSRNLELVEGDNLYWRMARHYGLDRLPVGLALQFEIVGSGVQGNPLGLDKNEIRIFTAYNTEEKKRMGLDYLWRFCEDYGLPMATIVKIGFGPWSSDQLRELADIKYPNGQPGEGVVIRGVADDSPLSIKVINLNYKDAS